MANSPITYHQVFNTICYRLKYRRINNTPESLYVMKFSKNNYFIEILKEDVLESYLIKWISKYGSEYTIPFPTTVDVLVKIITMFEEHTEYFKGV